MNYETIYNQLIDRARNRKLEGYKERHHIIPRCMNGTNDKSNLVDLTAREHFIAHKLLCEIYPGNVKLQYALWMLIHASSDKMQRDFKLSSREYEVLRTVIAEQMSSKMKGVPKSDEHRRKNSESKKGKLKSEETKKRMSESFKGRVFSDETRKKLSEANTGNTHSEETKRKIGAASKLRRHSEETKQKIRLARLQKLATIKLGFNQ